MTLYLFLGAHRDNLLFCLADLFSNIANQKRKVGTIAPKRFVAKLKRENGLLFYLKTFFLLFKDIIL